MYIQGSFFPPEHLRFITLPCLLVPTDFKSTPDNCIANPICLLTDYTFLLQMVLQNVDKDWHSMIFQTLTNTQFLWVPSQLYPTISRKQTQTITAISMIPSHPLIKQKYGNEGALAYSSTWLCTFSPFAVPYTNPLDSIPKSSHQGLVSYLAISSSWGWLPRSRYQSIEVKQSKASFGSPNSHAQLKWNTSS